MQTVIGVSAGIGTVVQALGKHEQKLQVRKGVYHNEHILLCRLVVAAWNDCTNHKLAALHLRAPLQHKHDCQPVYQY